jgi:hypothetical protein
VDLSALNSLVAAVCKQTEGRQVILFGSSSLLASFPAVDPCLIGVAVTIDADFFIDPDDHGLRRQLDLVLGEDKPYHNEHGFYGDFVDLRMASHFPQGWRDRLVPMPGFDAVWALHPMDMAVSKVYATANARIDCRFGRRPTDRGLKDIVTLVALIHGGWLDGAELQRRVDALDMTPAHVVECGRVMDTVLQLAGASPSSPPSLS